MGEFQGFIDPACARFEPVTARPFTVPARMCCATDGRLVNTTWIWPEIRSVSAGAAPL